MQGKKFLLTAINSFVAFSISSSAFAIMSVPNGWYLEGNIGKTHASNQNNGASGNSGYGVNVDLGYKFMPFFAAEFGYTGYPSSNINAFSTKAATVKFYSYDLSAKGIMPVSDSGFEAFAKVGVARVNAHISINNAVTASAAGVSGGSRTATGVYYGIGGQYYFSPELAGIVQWQRAEGNNTTGTLDLLSVGVSFIFG